MRARRPASPFADCSNVVNLGFYRREKKLRSSRSLTFQPMHNLRQSRDRGEEFWSDASYRDRMRANAVVFLFLIFLVTSGVWLLNGLNDAFGPERLSRQHTQTHDVSPGVITRLAHNVLS